MPCSPGSVAGEQAGERGRRRASGNRCARHPASTGRLREDAGMPGARREVVRAEAVDARRRSRCVAGANQSDRPSSAAIICGTTSVRLRARGGSAGRLRDIGASLAHPREAPAAHRRHPRPHRHARIPHRLLARRRRTHRRRRRLDRDAGLVPRVRVLGHLLARPARRARRAEAGAAPHPVPDGRDGPAPRPRPREERPRRRRGHGQAAPARRRADLRRAGAPRAAVLAARAAGRRPRQLRLARRRPGRAALHRGAAARRPRWR